MKEKQKCLDPGPNVAANVSTDDWPYVAPGPNGELLIRVKDQWWIDNDLHWPHVLSAPNQEWIHERVAAIIGSRDPLDFEPEFGAEWFEGLLGLGVGVVYASSVMERALEYIAGLARAVGAAFSGEQAPSPYVIKSLERRVEVFVKGFLRRHFTFHNGVIRKRFDANYDSKVEKGSSPEAEFVIVVSLISALKRLVLGIKLGNDMTANLLEALNVLNLFQAKLYQQCFGLSNGFLVMDGQKLPLDTAITMRIARGGQIITNDAHVGRLRDMQRSFADMIEFSFREQGINGPVYITTGTSMPAIWVNRGDIIRISANHGIGDFTQTVVQEDPPAEWARDDSQWLLKQIEKQEQLVADKRSATSNLL